MSPGGPQVVVPSGPQGINPGAVPSGIPGASSGLPAQAGPAIVPNTWLPQGGAILQALDKVNAQNATLTVKVGQSATFGSLVITVQACDIRPPDQPPDAAAYLMVTDAHANSPGFKGWMLKQEPEVNMLEHPIYDLRVTGCTP